MFLLLVFVRNPIAFVRAAWIGLSRDTIEGDNIPLQEVLDAIRVGLVMEHTAFHGGIIAKISERYAAIHNAARIELYRAAKPVALRGTTGVNAWRKFLGPVTPAGQKPAATTPGWFAEGADSSVMAALADLAAVINKTTGMISYAGLGIGEVQKHAEDRLIFPRYARCLLGLLTDAIQGRIRGNESRRLLVHLGVAVAVAYLLVG